MEFRKIIEFGKGSYVISLPKDWVLKNKLKKGNSLSLERSENSMMLSTDFSEEKEEKTSITISAEDKPIEEIKTEIITSYLTNYSIIEIVSKKIRENDEPIKEIIMNLAGLEILEQTATKITAKFLLDVNELSLDSLIRRMDNITRSLIIDAMECIKGACNYSSIKQRDLDVNRLHFLIMRTVRGAMGSVRQLKRINKSCWQLYTYLVIGEKLEKVADRQKRIARSLEQLKLSRSFADELKKVYESIYSSFMEVMKSYYQNDKKSALKIEISNKEKIIACNRLLGKDIKKEYKMIEREKSEVMSHVHEHMIMTEITGNLKAMATSVKMIARVVMNNEIQEPPIK